MKTTIKHIDERILVSLNEAGFFNKFWVSKLSATDPKYTFTRKYIASGTNEWMGTNGFGQHSIKSTGDRSATIEENGIYQVRLVTSYGTEDYFIHVTDITTGEYELLSGEGRYEKAIEIVKAMEEQKNPGAIFTKIYKELHLIRTSDGKRFQTVITTRYGLCFVNDGEFVSIANKMQTYQKKGLEPVEVTVTVNYKIDKKEYIEWAEITTSEAPATELKEKYDNFDRQDKIRYYAEKWLSNEPNRALNQKKADLKELISDRIETIEPEYFLPEHPECLQSMHITDFNNDHDQVWEIEGYHEVYGKMNKKPKGARSQYIKKYSQYFRATYDEATDIITFKQGSGFSYERTLDNTNFKLHA